MKFAFPWSQVDEICFCMFVVDKVLDQGGKCRDEVEMMREFSLRVAEIVLF